MNNKELRTDSRFSYWPVLTDDHPFIGFCARAVADRTRHPGLDLTLALAFRAWPVRLHVKTGAGAFGALLGTVYIPCVFAGLTHTISHSDFSHDLIIGI